MKIAKLKLINFKRFTDFTLDNIPPEAKLVLLIGSNGSGKSSVFDAFEAANTVGRQEGISDLEYYKKNKADAFQVGFSTHEGKKYLISTVVNNVESSQKSFYGRTSFRQIPRLTRTSLGQSGRIDFDRDTDRPRFFIDTDNRFENDIEKITEIILKEIFRTENSKEQVRKKYIDPINQALANIFGSGNGTKLKLIEIIPPLEGKVAQITFLKGNFEIHYNFLSAGEKEVVNILFNLLTRRDYYSDAVYFFDEIDLHLNTKLQFNLLKEITENWIPENCQFWTASHALGFIDYARQSEMAAILDLNDIDFDFPVTLEPVPKDKLDVYDVAIPKETIKNILKGYKLVVVENQNDEHYNLALGEKGFLFLPANNNREVFLTIKSDKNMLGLRDRDYLRDDEVRTIQKKIPNLKILELSTFENYIYHPDNIQELKWAGFNEEEYVLEITKQKKERLLQIVGEIGTSRQHYIEFKDAIKNDENIQPIIDTISSDDLNLFYPFFNMKKYFNKAYLNKYKYQAKDLVKTNWFKGKISSLLE